MAQASAAVKQPPHLGVRALEDYTDGAKVEIVRFDDRETWLEDRKKGIGASEAAAALGFDRYTSPLKLWARKTGKEKPEPDKPVMRRGRELEETVGLRYMEETGRQVYRPTAVGEHLARRRDLPFLSCSVDFLQFDEVHDGPGSVDGKTVGARMAPKWREDGELPFAYQVQIQLQVFVLGWDWGSLAGLLVNEWELETRDFSRHEKFLEGAVERLGRFWHCVETDTPPETAGEGDVELLRTLYPRKKGVEKVHTIPNEFDLLYEELVSIDRKRQVIGRTGRRLDKRRKEIEADVRAKAKDATLARVKGTNHAFAFSQRPRKGYTVPAGTTYTMAAVEQETE